MASNTFSCSICADIYKDSNDICSTVCGHIFHLSCLQKWQQRCPICNQTSPQPHRIFLDLETITDTKAKSQTGECKVTIKGIGASQLKEPLTEVVFWLAKIMNVSMMTTDIEHVQKHRNTLQVQFKSGDMRDLFLNNKYKLKHNPGTSAIVVHEVLDSETKDLFNYSHKLKQNGYQALYVKNGNIFAKTEKRSNPILILSKGQVDTLCKQTEYDTSIQSRPIIPENVNVPHATPHNVVYARSTSLSHTQSKHSNDVPRTTTSVPQARINYGSNIEFAQRAYESDIYDHVASFSRSYRVNREQSGCNIL